MKRSAPLLAAWLCAALSLCSVIRAQDSAAEKDFPRQARLEVLRRGDMIEHVDGYTAGEFEAVCAALELPADDSGKWFVSIVTMKGCPACEKLRADLKSHPLLQAWVNVEDYKQSWAHFQTFQIEDKSQEWRWKDFKPKGFPCVLVQPPVDGSFGNPKTLVFMQEGYRGPEQLDKAMRAAIKAYSAKVAPQHSSWRAKHERALDLASGYGQVGGPRPPVPAPTPLGPPSVMPSPVQTIPPQVEVPTVNPTLPSFGPVFSLLSGLLPTGTTFWVFVLVGLKIAELLAPLTPTKLDDEVVAVLKTIADNKQPKAP